jgi:hypothetical protein
VRILPQRVVHTDEEIRQLQRECNRTAGAAIGSQAARLIVEGLGGEYAAFECDNLGQLRGGGRRTGLRVTERGIGRLAGQTGLPAIPHDRAQEAEIGGRQRAPIRGDDACCRTGEPRDGVGIAVVGIIYGRDGELCSRRDRQADPDQTPVNQQLVSQLLGGEGRNVVARARGAVDYAKDRVGACARCKARGNVRCADGPAILRLVAAEAGSSIGSEILEERHDAVVILRERRNRHESCRGIEQRHLLPA